MDFYQFQVDHKGEKMNEVDGKMLDMTGFF